MVVVDDDLPCAEVIGELLEQELACHTLICTSGDQAVAMVDATQPQLVLLDLVLPRMSGEACLKALRSGPTTCGLPVVICSAASLQPSECQRLLDLGAAAILRKPFDVDDLLDLVRSFVASHATA